MHRKDVNGRARLHCFDLHMPWLIQPFLDRAATVIAAKFVRWSELILDDQRG